MMDLDNSDLVKLCATNKRMYDLCNNYPSFWRNKFVKDYGEHAAQYKPENRSWKNHYMTVFIDLQKFKKNPMKFFKNIAWKENVEESFFVDYTNRKLIPLKDAPEWVMVNLYLLNIDNIKLLQQDVVVEYKNVKPIEFLQILIPSSYYVIHFSKLSIGTFIPDYHRLEDFRKFITS
jgi:hypothetical protein